MVPRSLAKRVLSPKTGERLEDVFTFQKVGKDLAIVSFLKYKVLEKEVRAQSQEECCLP